MPEPEDQNVRLGFRLAPELAEETRRVIEQLRDDPNHKEHVAALVDLVLRLTDVGLREFYVRPLEDAKSGTLALGTAKIGISTAKRGISVVVNKLIKGMNETQLRSIADSMEDLLVQQTLEHR